MRILIWAFTAVLLAQPALAQQTPPPPPASGTTGSALGDLGKAVFTAMEKKAIEKFFGRAATPTEQVFIDAAKQAAGLPTTQSVQSGGTTTAKASDDDKDETPGWKKKGKKHEGKGKGRGKGKNKGMPPGLAKKKQLPPGLRKRLEKHGSLPPGLAKRDLPTDLQRDLTPALDGTERVIAGNDVVLVDKATNAVLDILYDVVSGKTQ
ncbi:MAG: hypothetical protein OXR84_14690 [Magnetovibrio sp.]|nr:hypothetical protein [Magnetovibrio sp.]